MNASTAFGRGPAISPLFLAVMGAGSWNRSFDGDSKAKPSCICWRLKSYFHQQ